MATAQGSPIPAAEGVVLHLSTAFVDAGLQGVEVAGERGVGVGVGGDRVDGHEHLRVEVVEVVDEERLGDGWQLRRAVFVLAVVGIVGSLILITKNMKALMADRIEQWLNRVLTRSGLLGLAIGAIITALVQSSSITTSLLVPIFGAGVLALEAGFPIMIGANIGTTITALMAAAVYGPEALTIAVVHLLFNLSGTAIFFPIKPLRRIPIMLAEGLANMAVRNRMWVVAYILGVFVMLPVIGIWIWKN